jgi:hypothetical protein
MPVVSRVLGVVEADAIDVFHDIGVKGMGARHYRESGGEA